MTHASAAKIRDLARSGGTELAHTHPKAGLALAALGEATQVLARKDPTFDQDLKSAFGGSSALSLALRARKAKAGKKKKSTKKKAAKRPKTKARSSAKKTTRKAPKKRAAKRKTPKKAAAKKPAKKKRATKKRPRK